MASLFLYANLTLIKKTWIGYKTIFSTTEQMLKSGQKNPGRNLYLLG